MKQKYWIVLIVVLLALTFLFFSSGYDQKITTNNTYNSADTTVSKPVVGKTNTSIAIKTDMFTNIFPQKGNYQCDYSEVSSSKATSGIVYFSDGKMRVEFRTSGSVGNIMVYDGVNMYSWVEGASSGSISRPKSISDFPAIIPKDFSTGKVLSLGSTSVGWYCHAWLKDASKLTRPLHINF